MLNTDNHPVDKLRQLQRKLYISAKKSPTRRFHALYERIHEWRTLEEAWKRVCSNKGACGIDGETLDEIKSQGVEDFLKGIQQYLKEGRYHPQPVRRVYIPKTDGKKRPLGIPTIRDRIVQTAAKIILEPVFEADFKDSSFGFRPKRSTADAMERIRMLANKGYNHVLDADIKDFFGSLDHEMLLEAVSKRISDRKVLKLIRKWLKVGVMEEAKLNRNLLGAPQGGVISPLLSNIYLHQLDGIWERKYSTLGALVRYCDDFVVLCRTQRAVKESQERIQTILKTIKLTFHPGKTKTVDLAWGKEGFQFLGWETRKCPSARFPGKFFLNRWPSRENMKKLRTKIRLLTRKQIRVKSVKELAPKLNPILRGWANYFRTGNSRRRFQQISYYLYRRLSLFENKRKGRKSPWSYTSPFGTEWFRSLGFFDLVRTGLIQYPGGRTLHALL